MDVITANPKTAGVARWNFFALWGARMDKGEATALDYVTKVGTSPAWQACRQAGMDSWTCVLAQFGQPASLQAFLTVACCAARQVQGLTQVVSTPGHVCVLQNSGASGMLRALV